MELVYTVSKVSRNKPDTLLEDQPICILSSRNIVAFTSTQQLPDTNDRFEPQLYILNVHIYIHSAKDDIIHAMSANQPAPCPARSQMIIEI